MISLKSDGLSAMFFGSRRSRGEKRLKIRNNIRFADIRPYPLGGDGLSAMFFGSRRSRGEKRLKIRNNIRFADIIPQSFRKTKISWDKVGENRG